MISSENTSYERSSFYSELQVVISIILLVVTLNLSGLKATITYTIIYYIIAVIEVILYSNIYIYIHSNDSTHNFDMLINIGDVVFIFLICSFVLLSSQAVLMRIINSNSIINSILIYLLPLIFSFVTGNIMRKNYKIKNLLKIVEFNMSPKKIVIWKGNNQEEEEPDLYIKISDNGKKDLMGILEIILNDFKNIEIDGGSTFKQEGNKYVASIELKREHPKLIGIRFKNLGKVTPSEGIIQGKLRVNDKITMTEEVSLTVK